MSRAKPMDAERRALHYTEVTYAPPGEPDGMAYSYRRMTPRQWRRWRRKLHRATGGYFGHWGHGCKGRPTPRQRKRAGRG